MDEIGKTRALSAKQLVAIAALLEGNTQGEAAKRAGVTRRTVEVWMSVEDPRGFRAALHAALDVRHRQAVALVRGAALDALRVYLDTIRRYHRAQEAARNADSPEEAAAARAAAPADRDAHVAAKAVLDRAGLPEELLLTARPEPRDPLELQRELRESARRILELDGDDE